MTSETPCVGTTNAMKNLEETTKSTDCAESFVTVTEIEVVNKTIQSTIDEFLDNYTQSNNSTAYAKLFQNPSNLDARWASSQLK
jgi:DNA polymerase/3'-5' exonuclease PolX